MPLPPLANRLNRCLLPFVALLSCLPLACSRAAPEETAPPATVKWESASQNNLEEWLELVGTTMPLPDHIARISAPVEGRVLSVLGSADKPVAEGQQVEKGTALVQLDTTVIKATLAKLEASQEVLQEELKQGQLALELANLEVVRLRKLVDGASGTTNPLVSPVERDKAELAFRDSQSKLKGAIGRLAAGSKEVEALKEQLRLFTLSAPISGRLGRLQVVVGQTLSVGALVADVTDIDDMIDVLCFVPPSLIGRLEKGQEAHTGALEKNPSAPIEVEAIGQIEYIAEQAEPETGNFAVKVRFPNKDAHLRANRVLRLCIKTKDGKECLALPEAAVQEDTEPPTVMIVQEQTNPKTQAPEWVARRMEAVLGVRDRRLHQIEIVSLTDPEKEPNKPKVQIEVKDAQFIVEGMQGLQTGDFIKQEAPDD